MTKSDHVYIIAEAGVNHNGSVELAKQLVDVAADAGADAVKFQTFKAERMISRHATKAAYQKKSTDPTESQLAMVKRLEIGEQDHLDLIRHCAARGIQFLSTPFDDESVELLATRLDLPRIKVSSGDLTNAPLLMQIARTGKPMIVSTGMSDLGEVEAALSVIAFGYLQGPAAPSIAEFKRAFASDAGKAVLLKKVTILHCTTEYPAPFAEVNLRAMDTLRTHFGLETGFSDHTPGISVPIAAVARGASIIEKHITLDKGMAGPDHKASLEPAELRAMVTAIRQVSLALGSPLKASTEAERKNMPIARKSLVAARPIAAGEAFSALNLTVKRPGSGVAPIRFWEYLCRKADRAYEADELI